jgi:outer membrane protein assembly factor BamD (BamD/ComL family)
MFYGGNPVGKAGWASWGGTEGKEKAMIRLQLLDRGTKGGGVDSRLSGSAMKNLVMFILVACCMAGCSAASKDWEIVRSKDTVSSYRNFLQKYPDSTFAKEARERLEAVEVRDWKKAQSEDKPGAYRTFLKIYPDSRFAGEAKAKILELEKSAWERAQAEDSAKSYKEFLQHYPASAFAATARTKARELSWEEAQKSHTVEAYSGFIEEFKNTPPYHHMAEAQKMLQQVQKIREEQWEEDLPKAVTVDDWEHLLVKYPNQAGLIVPKIEAAAITEIRKNGVGSRYVIKALMPHVKKSAGSTTLQADGTGTKMLLEFPGDRVFTPAWQPNTRSGGFPEIPFGEGSIHRFVGAVPVSEVHTVVGEGDQNHRLTFVLLKGYGAVYLRGTGRVLERIGTSQNETPLGYPKHP